MFLLPWERLPLWIQGPILAFAGGAIVVGEAPWSWEQIFGWICIFMGICLFIHGVTTLPPGTGDGRDIARRNARPYSQEMTPDFARYNEGELRQILSRLDKDRYPDRAREVYERLAAFEARSGQA